MKKKKPIIIGIICGVVVIAAAIGVILYIHFAPYIRLKQTADHLLNKEYEYTVEGKVEGMNLKLLGNSFQGTIKGEKGKDVISGDIIYKNSTYLKIYADKQENIIFDVTPLIDAAIDRVADSSPLIGGLIRSVSSDVKISYAQIEEVLDQNIISLNDEGVSNELVNQVIYGKAEDYTLTVLKEISPEDELLGTDAYYFEMDLKNYDTKLIIGVPRNKNDTKWSVNVYTDKITWSFVGEYEIKNLEEIKMPESTVSDETIDILKMLYGTYLEIRDK